MAKRKINYSKTQCTFKNRIFLDEEKLVETKVIQTKNVTFSSFTLIFLQKYLLLPMFIDYDKSCSKMRIILTASDLKLACMSI